MKDINKLRLIGKVVSPPEVYDGEFSQTMQNDVYFKSVMKVLRKVGATFITVLYPKELFDFMKTASESNTDVFAHGSLTSCFDDNHFNMLVLLNKAEYCKYDFTPTRANMFVLSGKLIKSPKLFALPKKNAYGLLIKSYNNDGKYENIHGSFQTPNGAEPLLNEGDDVACKGYLYEKIGSDFRSFFQKSEKYDPEKNFLRLKFLYVVPKETLTRKSKDELHHFDSNNFEIKNVFYNLYEEKDCLNRQ